ncbi:MAG: hypothetical protein K2H41_05650 [Acetatifactor sp.]|nr:hypothetical protein [Acetatifactor sp.]
MTGTEQTKQKKGHSSPRHPTRRQNNTTLMNLKINGNFGREWPSEKIDTRQPVAAG